MNAVNVHLLGVYQELLEHISVGRESYQRTNQIDGLINFCFEVALLIVNYVVTMMTQIDFAHSFIASNCLLYRLVSRLVLISVEFRGALSC